MESSKPILLSGIKPTGTPHIGNYFGALKQWVDLANTGQYESFVMVADYHALNFIQDAQQMRELTHDLVRTLLAIGLDPVQVAIFKQSDVAAHTELAWVFDTITTMPYLSRAHAFKDAEAKGAEISVGTFTYPMLMAADILLYDTNVVPIGQDQKQHVEYARDTAEKFNRIYAHATEAGGAAFVLPEPHIMPDVAIVPGTDGRKMSKSYSNTIPLFASREEITEAVMSIVTDSGAARPEHVYAIHRLLKTEAELEPLYAANEGKYHVLKLALIEELDTFIAPMRDRYHALAESPSDITGALTRGAEKARGRADAKMKLVRAAVGVA